MALPDSEWAVRFRSVQRIADTLGVPVEAFYGDGEAAFREAQTDEMLRLWSALTSAAAREELLDHARASAGKFQAQR